MRASAAKGAKRRGRAPRPGGRRGPAACRGDAGRAPRRRARRAAGGGRARGRGGAARRPGRDARAGRPPGGLGERRHLRALGQGPHGGDRRGRRLRPGLPGRAAGALPQGARLARPAAGRAAARPRRLHVGRPRARARARADRAGRDRGLPRRRRPLVPLDRGREPALPAPGEDVRRLPGPLGHDRARSARRSARGPDHAGDPPRRRGDLLRRDVHRCDRPAVRGARRVSLPRALASARRRPADRHRPRPAGRDHAGGRRRGRDRDRGRRRIRHAVYRSRGPS